MLQIPRYERHDCTYYDFDNAHVESTFAMIKRGPVERGEDHEIMEIIELRNIEIYTYEKTILAHELMMKVFRPHNNSDLIWSLGGVVVLMWLRGNNIVARWNEMMGHSDPNKADGTSLRAAYGSFDNKFDNALHGSRTVQFAKWELKHIFNIVTPPR